MSFPLPLAMRRALELAAEAAEAAAAEGETALRAFTELGVPPWQAKAIRLLESVEHADAALRAEGDRFSVSYDGKTLFSVTDRTFAEAGGVALWTKADSVTRFDRIAITPLP